MARSGAWSGRGWLLLSALSIVSPLGCGGGQPVGKPLTEQYQDALKISDASQRVKKLVAVAQKQQQAADQMGMTTSLGAAENAAKSIADPADQAGALIALASGFAKLDQSPQATKGLVDAATLASEKIDDPEARANVLAELATAIGQGLKNPELAAYHLKNAETAAAAVELHQIRSRLLGKIAVAYHDIELSAECDRLSTEAREFAAGRDQPREQVDCLAELAAAYYRGKLPKKGEAAVSEARQLAATIAEPESRGYALVRVAQVLKTANQKDVARSVLVEAQDIAGGIKDGSLRAPLLEEIDRSIGAL
jgi:hypothetical protein